ncbi:hypothetical protein ACVWZL_001040 [Bradyrhizobium sp. GM2.4]
MPHGGLSSERQEKECSDDGGREKWKPNVRHFRDSDSLRRIKCELRSYFFWFSLFSTAQTEVAATRNEYLRYYVRGLAWSVFGAVRSRVFVLQPASRADQFLVSSSISIASSLTSDIRCQLAEREYRRVDRAFFPEPPVSGGCLKTGSISMIRYSSYGSSNYRAPAAQFSYRARWKPVPSAHRVTRAGQTGRSRGLKAVYDRDKEKNSPQRR